MNRLALLVVLAVPAIASASPSNPAFLGISFGPSGPNGALGAVVSTVTPDSPAARAGLQSDDVIMSVDGKMVDVTTLNTFIIAHQPGESIRLDIVRRGGQLLTLTPILTTRADMFDRLLGHPLPRTELLDSETGDKIELGNATGHATVITWYRSNGGGAACIDAVPVVHDIARRVSAIQGGEPVVLAATYFDERDSGGAAHDARKRLGLPLALTTREAFANVAIDECGRVFAMVLDCRGTVTFLTPISDGDDEDAALDEIATAAAQADHKRR